MSINLSQMSTEEFASLKTEIEQEEKRREKEHIESLFQRVSDLPDEDLKKLVERIKKYFESKKQEAMSQIMRQSTEMSAKY